jgi:hypothetical protein
MFVNVFVKRLHFSRPNHVESRNISSMAREPGTRFNESDSTRYEVNLGL